MTDTYQLRTNEIRQKLIGDILKLEISEEDPFQIMIMRGKDLRSKAQNHLYWKHMAEWSAQTGDEIEDCFQEGQWTAGLHYSAKRKHLHPIYMAGKTKKNHLYQLNFAEIVKIKQGSGDNLNFKMLHSKILSTTDASVKQMYEYIESYWREATANKLFLTDPNTFYAEN